MDTIAWLALAVVITGVSAFLLAYGVTNVVDGIMDKDDKDNKS